LLRGDLRPDDVDDVVERLAQRGAARQVLEEGALAAKRFADAVGAHRPQVDAAGGAIEVFGEAAEMLAQESDVLGCEVRSGLDAKAGHLLRTARTDPVKPPDRKAGDECRAFARPDDAEAV